MAGRVLAAFVVALILVGTTVTAATAKVVISIDKRAQRMAVIVDGVPRHVWPVSTGARGYDTPSGTFTPFRLERDHFSAEWDDAPMPHSIFFTTRGHAIHGSYSSRLGTRASHGCVRIAPGNARILFSLVERQGLGNTQVVIRESGGVAVARGSKAITLKVPKGVRRLLQQ